MVSIGDYAFGKTLVLSGELSTPSKMISNGNDGHQISNNGSVVYFKYAQELAITSITTQSGSPNVTITCSSATGLHTSASNGHLVSISDFTPVDLDGLDLSDFQTKLEINNHGTPSATQLQFVASNNATSGGTFAATGRIVVHTYKYLDLHGPGVTWQVARFSAPDGVHSNP